MNGPTLQGRVYDGRAIHARPFGRAARLLGPWLVLLAACLPAASCARRAETAERPPRLVTAQAVERRDFALTADYAARIVPEREVKLTPKVGGRVAAVEVEVGARVAAGQLLCRLDASDYEAQYRQAQAALGSARAALTRTSDSGQEQQTLQARSAADQARVAYDEAKKAYDRTKRLFDSGSVSRQQLDDVEARYKAAGIQKDAADSGLAIVEDKAGAQASDIASSQVDQARAAADLARSQLDATAIRSPIAGRVSYRDVEVGELVGPSTLAFVVIGGTEVAAELSLSERVIGSVRRGMPMELEVPALGADARVAGRVDSVSPAADPRSMLFAVRLLVPNPQGLLRGGMLARAKVPLETRKGALLVPERATFSENGGDYVFVATPSASGADARGRPATVSKRLVKLGESDGSVVEAREGLSAGELVVTAGQEFLGEGDRVTLSE